ncbi:hypothetical protein KAU88_02500 [Candidatus Bathyarchaeota archaeon]|nr:hypothetical protein [Candidatus Bathyarchaeota archaeon]
MDQYSIISFLESLADDEIEKVLIRLISEGNQGEDLLRKLLETIVGIKNDNI